MSDGYQLSGRFVYDSATRALVFDFDEKSKEYMAGEKINHFIVQVHDVHQNGVWLEAHTRKLHERIPAARLTFSNQAPNAGVLVGMTQTAPVAPWLGAIKLESEKTP